MKTTEMLSKIKALLNASVKLAQQTLDNGTVIEAESFEGLSLLRLVSLFLLLLMMSE
jgi:hypothetical protein